MRASNLSLVIVTGYCLLWAVKAQTSTPSKVNPPPLSIQGPLSIGILSSTWIVGREYTITWGGCYSDCKVLSVNVVEVNVVTLFQDSTQSTPFQTLQVTPCGQDTEITTCAIATASEPLSSGSSYDIDVTWVKGATATIVAVVAIGNNLNAPTPLGTQSSTESPQSSVVASVGSPNDGSSPLSAPAATSSSLASTSGGAGKASSSGSSSLSTGAKIGIAIGAVGLALIILIAALLIWCRSRQRQLRALPNGMPYSHDTMSTNRDLTAEKEMNVINSPVDTLHNRYSSIPPVIQTQSRSQTGSLAHPGEQTAAHRGSYGSGYEDSTSPIQNPQPHMPPPVAAGAAIQRKPVGAVSGPTNHLREPGMSDDEVARLEEEERRLDEAIAEAERRRQVQG